MLCRRATGRPAAVLICLLLAANPTVAGDTPSDLGRPGSPQHEAPLLAGGCPDGPPGASDPEATPQTAPAACVGAVPAGGEHWYAFWVPAGHTLHALASGTPRPLGWVCIYSGGSGGCTGPSRVNVGPQPELNTWWDMEMTALPTTRYPEGGWFNVGVLVDDGETEGVLVYALTVRIEPPLPAVLGPAGDCLTGRDAGSTTESALRLEPDTVCLAVMEPGPGDSTDWTEDWFLIPVADRNTQLTIHVDSPARWLRACLDTPSGQQVTCGNPYSWVNPGLWLDGVTFSLPASQGGDWRLRVMASPLPSESAYSLVVHTAEPHLGA